MNNEFALATYRYYGYNEIATKMFNFLDTQIWNKDSKYFKGELINTRDTLDATALGVLVMGRDYVAGKDYILSHHRSNQTMPNTTLKVDGFDHNSDKNDIFFSG
jgi:hypothetical protein